ELDPDYAWVWRVKGETLRQMERCEEALAAFEHAIALDSEYAAAYVSRGRAYHELNQYEQAIADYEQATTIRPEAMSTMAWLNLGIARYLLGKTEEALKTFAEAARRDESAPAPHNNLGFLLIGKGRYDEGIDEISRALELGHEFQGVAYNNLGYAYLMLGDLEQAKDTLETAIKEATSDTAILRLVFYHRKFQLVEEPVYPKKFVNILVTAHCNLATVLARQGDFEAALGTCKQAIEGWPDDPIPHQAIGHIYLEMGIFEDALPAFERARQLDPEDERLTDLTNFTQAQLAPQDEE
ncbi:MAG: tetratricopeptide repeat protein, partial [Anaerolineae bacterium]|nr:tetratricopeptide repeat protein [Anaerolineae bacterium]